MPSRHSPPRKRIDPRDPNTRLRGQQSYYDPAPPPRTVRRARPEPEMAPSTRRVYLALLPLRFFLGGMLLYAGLDKLLDPTFLHSTGAGSIGQQLEGFTHASPLTPLIQIFAQPFPVEVGLLIAVAEIAIGIGALTGLLYRASAWAGFGLSILFWLTASWTVRPYYYGPDLPYAFGWLTLALAGSGGLYTMRSWFDALAGTADLDGYEPVSEQRRLVLQAAGLGVAAVFLAGGVGVLARVLRGGDDGASAGTAAAGTSPLASAPPSALPSSSAAAGATAPAATDAAGGAGSVSGGTAIAKLNQLQKGQAYEFQDPNTGDPAVIIKLASDHVVAYDAICTHQGCTVGYDSASGLLMCPCHGAAFDPTHGAAVVAGPTNVPLTSLPLHIDPATGQITLKA